VESSSPSVPTEPTGLLSKISTIFVSDSIHVINETRKLSQMSAHTKKVEAPLPSICTADDEWNRHLSKSGLRGIVC
jgi:hypothetical protein